MVNLFYEPLRGLRIMVFKENLIIGLSWEDNQMHMYRRFDRKDPMCVRSFPLARSFVCSNGDIYELDGTRKGFSYKYTLDEVIRINVPIPSYHEEDWRVVPYKNYLFAYESTYNGRIKNITTKREIRGAGTFLYFGDRYIYIINIQGELEVRSLDTLNLVYSNKEFNLSCYLLLELPSQKLIAYSNESSKVFIFDGFSCVNQLSHPDGSGGELYFTENLLYTPDLRVFKEF